MRTLLIFFISYPLCAFSGVFYKDVVGERLMAEELAFVYIKNIYGEEAAIEQKPYRVSEMKKSWLIKGALREDDCTCGNFVIRIGKQNGAIEEIYHTK